MAKKTLISKANHYNALLKRILNEFEILEVNDYENGCYILSNFGILENGKSINDNGLGCIIITEIPTSIPEYFTWIYTNGYKSGVREMTDAEKSEKLLIKKQELQKALIRERNELLEASNWADHKNIRQSFLGKTAKKFSNTDLTDIYTWQESLSALETDHTFLNDPANYKFPTLRADLYNELMQYKNL